MSSKRRKVADGSAEAAGESHDAASPTKRKQPARRGKKDSMDVDTKQQAPVEESPSKTVQIGYLAPNFTAEALFPDGEVKQLSLSDYRGHWVYLFFYPLDFTFVCPTEICAFSDAAAKFEELDCKIIGASVDSAYTHHAWVNTPRKEGGLGGIKFPLVADVTQSVAKLYNSLLSNGHTLRSSFIIDPRGVVRHLTMNDPPVGRSVDEALRLLAAFQYADEHGEVCPANWKPGSDAIVPHIEKKKEYFAKISE